MRIDEFTPGNEVACAKVDGEISALRAELTRCMEQALEVEQQREAEINARIARAYEDARAFTAIAEETRARIAEIRADLASLQERRSGDPK